MLDTLATRRDLASPTVFTSHYRKNGRFQTSAPVFLKHSLSFTLQLFRPTIPHTQTLTLHVIVLRSYALPFRARAQVTLSGPLVSLFLCTRAPISLVAVACTRTERSTQTVRRILSRFEHRGLKLQLTHFGRNRIRCVSHTPYTHGTQLLILFCHTVLAPHLMSRSQLFLSSTSGIDSVRSFIYPDHSVYTVDMVSLAVVSLPS